MTKQYKVGDRVSVSYINGPNRLATVATESDYVGYTNVVFDDDPERHKYSIAKERLSDEPFVDELYFSEIAYDHRGRHRQLRVTCTTVDDNYGFVSILVDDIRRGVHLSPRALRELAADLVKLAAQIDAE